MRTLSLPAPVSIPQNEPARKRLGRPPKNTKPEPVKAIEPPKEEKLPKSKRLLSKLKELNKQKEATTVGKKSARLSSVSSVSSSTISSSNIKVNKNITKQLETIDFENGDAILNQSDIEDIDEIDNLQVSDCETNETEPASKNEQVLKPNNSNLNLIGTYKVKIQLRNTSTITTNIPNNNNKQKENIETKTDHQTPHKISNLFVLNTPTATPSKTTQINTSINNQTEQESSQQNSNATAYFECPECDKKFVSRFGLFQHYDQHPTLAVTCPMCSITFENHHVLMLHDKNAHNIQSKDKETDKEAHKQQKPKAKNKNKTKPVDEVSNQVIDNDLSALPSIMTRTSRLINNNQNNNISKPSLITAAALLNHSLKYKTSGFADLSFIDFSCVKFPQIAQNFCELWPRKLQSTDLSTQQPLHNYMCDKCEFYFPCKASLVLHKMNNSKTHLIDENQHKVASRCQLFMTNSKYLCYEKCLDEIITKIEQELETEQTVEFLKTFDLVPSNTLPKLHELTSTEKLLLKLRQQMLDINHQFIIDLDRWKFIHSNQKQSNDSNSEQSVDYYHDSSSQYSNKIHLKPHVNLNRPLLIRSKKFKRNNSKLNALNTNIRAQISRPIVNHKLAPAQLVTFKSILNAINSVNITSTTSNIDSKPKINTSTSQSTAVTTTTTTKFSKPLFSATSGNFSAAVSNKQNKPTMNSMLVAGKKRKLIEKQQVLEKKRKQKEEEEEDVEIEDEERSIDEESIDIKDNSDIKIEEEDDDDDIQLIEDIQPDPPKLTMQPQRRIASVIPVVSKKLLLPPPLYKAPNSSSATSSILASASGMSNYLLQSKTSNNMTMPKLQPVSSVKNSIDSSNFTMPKLKPYNSIQSNKRPSLPPPPPLTLMTGFNSTQVNKKQKSDEIKMPQLTHCSKNMPQLTSCSKNMNQATSSTLSKAVKSSENLSLKCKFCFEVFKGQSEFFQHVIESHPKMLEQRLNRPANKSNTSSSNSSMNSNTNSQDSLFRQPTTTSNTTITASDNSSHLK